MKHNIASQIAYLHVTSWRGVSIGAQHWYGKLVCTEPYQSIELLHNLTQKQADALNDYRNREFPGDKHPYIYRAGYETNGFDDKDSIKRLAKRTYKKHFPNSKVLLLGNPAYGQVALPIDAPKDFITLSKSLYKQCEKLGWYDNPKNDRIMDKIYDTWHTALEAVLAR